MTVKPVVEEAWYQAETDKFNAEAEAARMKARTETAVAAQHEIQLRSLQRAEAVELAKDYHHHVYIFDDSVNDSSVNRCINQLTTWHRQDPTCDIEIVVNSPGGSIFDGFVLIDFLRDLREKGHKITMVAYGMAASMAGVLMQAGTVRAMGENAFMLIHEGSLGAIGDFGQVEDRIKLMELMHDKILALFEDRATPINKKTTAAFIKRSWKRKDWWITAEECLKLGFVDEIR